MNLFKDYRNNVALYDTWHAYFRAHQPKTLVAWGRGDPFFGVAGALAYQKDLAHITVELLDAGHFALEERAVDVAVLIKKTFC